MRWTSSSGPGGITPAGKPTPRQKECSAASRPSGVCKRVNASLCRYSWVTCGHETDSIASTVVNTHIGQVACSWSRTQEATLRSHRRRPIHSNLVNLRVKLLLGHQAPRMHTRELAGFGVANDLAHFLTFLLASPPLIDRDEKQEKREQKTQNITRTLVITTELDQSLPALRRTRTPRNCHVTCALTRVSRKRPRQGSHPFFDTFRPLGPIPTGQANSKASGNATRASTHRQPR